ncbi:MAG: hypothetical protein LBL82_04380 [Oscillospiraceae bacterium]|jgi:spore maturation protein A|nr:hypothetical protein [Oscillospiraceae bacterium]
MMNYIFVFLILIAAVFSVFSGRADATANSLLSAGGEAVELCFTLMGAMCLWGGLMRVAEKAGITKALSKVFAPLLGRLMPSLKKNKKAEGFVLMNVASNLLGLGNAATPLGLEAMKSLKAESKLGDRATSDMMTFVVLNTASIQLIPSTLAVLRGSMGSVNPLDILPCVWISSVASVAVGLIICKMFGGNHHG